MKNALEECQLRLASMETKKTRQALLIPLAIVEAMEEMVVCDDAKPFSRAYAWFRLVKI